MNQYLLESLLIFQCQQNHQLIRLRRVPKPTGALSQEKQHSGYKRLSIFTGKSWPKNFV